MSINNNAIIFGTGQRIFAAPSALAPIQPSEIISMPTSDVFHTMCFGQSGAGKSRGIVSFCTNLLHQGVGFTLLDPSDTADLLLGTLVSLGYFDHHPDPFNALIFLDLPAAFKQGYFPPFNILKTFSNAHDSADLVTEAFRRLFGTSDSMTSILSLVKAGTYVLAKNNLPLFPYLYYLVTDSALRHALLENTPDELIKRFFSTHTSPRTGQLQLGTDAILKRLFLLTYSPALRYPLACADNPIFDYRSLIGENRSVVVNLNLRDTDALRLWGALIVLLAETGAKARGEIAAADRTGTHCLIADESQNWLSNSATGISRMLMETRKVGLFCFAATQSPSVAVDALRAAMDNVDIVLSYRLARPAAEQLVASFGFPIDNALVKDYGRSSVRYYTETEQEKLYIQALTALGNAEALVRLRGNRVYKLRSLTVPNPKVPAERLEEIRQEYIRRYCIPQQNIEKSIAEQVARIPGAAPAQTAPQPADDMSFTAQPEDYDDILRD